MKKSAGTWWGINHGREQTSRTTRVAYTKCVVGREEGVQGNAKLGEVGGLSLWEASEPSKERGGTSGSQRLKT